MSAQARLLRARRQFPLHPWDSAVSAVTALRMFRRGMDTAEIAAFLGCREAEVYNALARARR